MGNRGTAKDQRIEARATAEQKARLERAAQLSGRSVSDFVLASADEAARRVLREESYLELNDQQSDALARTLLADEAPGERLRRAADRYVDAAATAH